MRWLWILCLSFLIAAGAVPSGAAVLEVHAPPALESAAEQLRRLEPAFYAPVLGLVGLEEAGALITVVLAAEGSQLAAAAPPWVNGYAHGALGRIVLFPGRVPAYPDRSLDDLLRHELAHVLIARAAGFRRVPRWFDEGLAMTAGGEWGLADRTRLALLLLHEEGFPLADLDQRFRGGSGDVAGAYALAGAFVNDLLRRHGPAAPAPVLRGVAVGLSFEAAFERATGEALEAAEAAFWRRLSWSYRWLPVLTSSTALWIGVTLLALAAIARRRRRDALLAKQWEEEERASPAAWERGD